MGQHHTSSANMRHGYTLIELLVIIAIISILVAIGVPNLLEAETRSKIARTRMDMQSIATALQGYATDNTAFPPAPNDTDVSPLWQGPQQFCDNGGFRLTSPIAYITNIPLSIFQLPGTPRVPGSGFYFFNYAYQKHVNQDAAPGDECPFAIPAVAKGVEWVIWSLGPALGDPSSSNGVIYDPTNGNVSVGRVAYFSDRGGHPDMYNWN